MISGTFECGNIIFHQSVDLAFVLCISLVLSGNSVQR